MGRSEPSTVFFVHEARARSRTIWIGSLVRTAMIAILVAAGYPSLRVLSVALLFVAVLLGQLVGRRARVTSSPTVAAHVFVAGATMLTGGVYSPFLPNLVLPAMVALLFYGPTSASRWAAVANGLVVVAVACMPSTLAGPVLERGPLTASIVAALAWNLYVLHETFAALRRAASHADAAIADLREGCLAQADSQTRRLQSVGGHVADELKNPLSAIKGLCQLISRDPGSRRSPERLAVALSEIDRMERILDEYLAFARPLEDLHRVGLELGRVAEEAVDLLRDRATRAGIALHSEHATGDTVYADHDRLLEAIVSLVSNAIAATASGGAVTLRVHRDRDMVVLDIVDTGCGMPPADLAQLGNSMFKRRSDGTGLGVLLARGVLSQHAGTLDYVSEIGRGTTATIRLPAVDSLESSKQLVT